MRDGDIDRDGKGGGTVFAFNGTSLQVLYAFCAEANCADGEQPLPHPAMDSAGNLYGTTFYGGAFGAGGGLRSFAVTHGHRRRAASQARSFWASFA